MEELQARADKWLKSFGSADHETIISEAKALIADLLGAVTTIKEETE